MSDESPDSPEGFDSTERLGGSATPGRIGNYRLIQMIGEGGMGDVWETEQEKPVRRRVALKLIKLGMDTKTVIARFEAERQALALMNHHNVAKVFDAGATEHGRPYFVMELVKGVRITEHCDTHRLTTKERLELFMQVCEGVQHAHQKGILHRDIKPSNILVAREGGDIVPKIIDFGVAKATALRLTEKTLFTGLGQLIGTPAYMSPEQADPTNDDIDTRTDVYSLGVLLYELLVGVRPFDSRQLVAAGFDELRRIIREQEPSRPSVRVSTLEDSNELARRRRTEARSLASQLRGDLDWITMKALEKDRTRRYGSPSELAADIRRHLRHEPVVASPPSMAYRARKFLRRHRASVGVATAALLLLLAFAVTMTMQAGRIVRERDRANREATRASKAGTIADRTVEFLVHLFEESDPGIARDVLDKGTVLIPTESTPLVRAHLAYTLGRGYLALGLHDLAQPLLEESLRVRRLELDPDESDVTSSMVILESVVVRLADTGEFEQAIDLQEVLVQAQEELFGAESERAIFGLRRLWHLLVSSGDDQRADAVHSRMRSLLPSDAEDAELVAVEASLVRVGNTGSRERLRSNGTVAVGDQLMLELEASNSVYLYVVNKTERGDAFLLFPLPELDLQNPLPAFRAHSIPGSMNGVSRLWNVATASGREHLLIIASPAPLTEFEAVIGGTQGPAPQGRGEGPIENPSLSQDALSVIRNALKTPPDEVSRTERRSNTRLVDWVQTTVTPEVIEGVWIRRIWLDSVP